MVKREGYPTNYEFTGQKTSVTVQEGHRSYKAFIVGYQEAIIEDYFGHQVPPCGFYILELEDGSIRSFHERFIKW